MNATETVIEAGNEVSVSKEEVNRIIKNANIEELVNNPDVIAKLNDPTLQHIRLG